MDLRQEVMINQLSYVTGCGIEQAKQLLISSKWHLESALSMFFQEAPLPPCQCQSGDQCRCRYTMATPSNTPVTPPSFPDALSALAKLSTGGESSCKTLSPSSSSAASAGESMFGAAASATTNQKTSVVAAQSMFGMVHSQQY